MEGDEWKKMMKVVKDGSEGVILIMGMRLRVRWLNDA